MRVFRSAAAFGRPPAWRIRSGEMMLDWVGRAFWVLRVHVNAAHAPDVFLNLGDILAVSREVARIGWHLR